MTTAGDERRAWEERRDQALADLVDVDRQEAVGELPPEVADRLRAQYEAVAAAAITALREQREEREGPAAGDPSGEAPGPGAPPAPRGRRWRLALYAATAAGALVAAAVLLPGYLGTRPVGGFVSGNEPLAQASATPTPRDLSTVSTAEMEAVVRQNPDVLGMRLALAARYVQDGQYDKATQNYAEVLKRDPGNAEALAHLGWILLQLGDPARAADFVGRARAADPSLVDAMWFQANIRLYGLKDPAGALDVLDQMSRRTDLSPQVRQQVADLTRTAQQQAGR